MHLTQHHRRIVYTLVIGLIGAGLGIGLGLPVAPLLGSAILVSIVTLLGVPTASSNVLRNLSFTTVGCSLGSGITPDSFALMGQWSLSLVGLAITVVVMMYASTGLLVRFYGQTATTGLLASSPGALSSVLAMASSGYGNLRAIVVLQGLRLLLVMAVLPIIIDGLNLQGVGAFKLGSISLDYALMPSLIGSAYVAALLLERIKFPAAYVLAGLLMSGVGHGSGLITGVMPSPLISIAFVLIGCTVGVRFNGITRQELGLYASAAMASVLLSSGIAAVAAGVVSYSLALPFGQVWIAYAPGGVEAMAALAMALHFDPAYVALHHLARIVGLVLILPWVIKQNDPPP